MAKQKVILVVVVVLIFAGIVYLGFRALSGPKQSPQGGAVPAPTWQDPSKPAQSPPVNEADVPEKAIKLVISGQGISPASFDVKKGQEVVLSITSQDDWTHIFRFKDEDLKKVAVGVGPGQTRLITFYAPKDRGEYEFFCDVPGHSDRGEKGTMLVK